ncbi:2TM domain-containing protein [Hyphomicrobium sp. CS1GBMeth3]|uniref:2TM domain-containing protein n=1 Tax=Hyphomicrobium sp. CS1GBMeth3 TaxID=1892845 RepID=UPI0009312A50|nr:2TM domain-containing protein [Hyphomicrobium sp. CS1GBMeth3]
MDDLFEHLMESERDKAINGFYTHFIVFLSVIAALAVVNLISGGAFWIQWVVLGWGIGVAFHAYTIFVLRPRREHEARERRRAELERRTGASAAGSPGASDPTSGQ